MRKAALEQQVGALRREVAFLEDKVTRIKNRKITNQLLDLVPPDKRGSALRLIHQLNSKGPR